MGCEVDRFVVIGRAARDALQVVQPVSAGLPRDMEKNSRLFRFSRAVVPGFDGLDVVASAFPKTCLPKIPSTIPSIRPLKVLPSRTTTTFISIAYIDRPVGQPRKGVGVARGASRGKATCSPSHVQQRSAERFPTFATSSYQLAQLAPAERGGFAREGRSRRLLDVYLHQLAAHTHP
jgi:hypothetical protein